MAKRILKELFFKSSDTSKVKYNIGADAENILIKNEDGTAYGDRDKHKNLQSKLNILNRMIRTSSSEGYSHVSGVAEGSYSTAFGVNTKARGVGSHAEGGYVEVNHEYAHGEGFNTTVGSAYQHVQGKYNKVEEDKVHIVGWGESNSNRSNIHTLDTKGNAWFKGGINAINFNDNAILLTDINPNYGKYYLTIEAGQIKTVSKVSSIRVSKLPNNLLYSPDYSELDLTGLEISITRDDGTIEKTSVLTKFNITGQPSPDNNTIRIVYTEFGIEYQCEFNIEWSNESRFMQDFDYLYDGSIYRITGWRGTYAGKTSTIMEFPRTNLGKPIILVSL